MTLIMSDVKYNFSTRLKPKDDDVFEVFAVDAVNM